MEWLRLLPNVGALPQIAQILDIAYSHPFTDSYPSRATKYA